MGDWDGCTSLLKNFLHSVYIYIHIYICIETYHVWCPFVHFFLFSYCQVCMFSHCSLSFALHSVSTSQVNANLFSCCATLFICIRTHIKAYLTLVSQWALLLSLVPFMPAAILEICLTMCRPYTILGKGLFGTARSSLFLSVYCASAWLVRFIDLTNLNITIFLDPRAF